MTVSELKELLKEADEAIAKRGAALRKEKEEQHKEENEKAPDSQWDDFEVAIDDPFQKTTSRERKRATREQSMKAAESQKKKKKQKPLLQFKNLVEIY